MSDSEYREDSQYLLEPETRRSLGGVDGEDALAYGGNWFARLFIFLMVLAALVALASYASQWKKGLLVKGFGGRLDDF